MWLVAEETPHHHPSESNEAEYENIVEQAIDGIDRHETKTVDGVVGIRGIGLCLLGHRIRESPTTSSYWLE